MEDDDVFGCSDFIIFEIIVISDFRLYRFAHLRIFRFSDSRKLQAAAAPAAFAAAPPATAPAAGPARLLAALLGAATPAHDADTTTGGNSIACYPMASGVTAKQKI